MNVVYADDLRKEDLEKSLNIQRKQYINQLTQRDNNIEERINTTFIDFKDDIHGFYNFFLLKLSIIIIFSESTGLIAGFLLISWIESIKRSIRERKPKKGIIVENKPILKPNLHKKGGVSCKIVPKNKVIKPELGDFIK